MKSTHLDTISGAAKTCGVSKNTLYQAVYFKGSVDPVTTPSGRVLVDVRQVKKWDKIRQKNRGRPKHAAKG